MTAKGPKSSKDEVTREEYRQWLENNSRPIAIVLFAAFGILLLAKGASGLWA